jgi:hypothetical protein
MYVYRPSSHDCLILCRAAYSSSGMEGRANPGFAHMASALLAMEHFNDRNTEVVPELAEFDSCPFRFDLNKSRVFDTGIVGHMASKALFSSGELPCAIAGPFNDDPALDLTTLAEAGELPLVAHRAYNSRVISKIQSGISHQTYPDAESAATITRQFLKEKERYDFFTVLYPSVSWDRGLSVPVAFSPFRTTIDRHWDPKS